MWGAISRMSEELQGLAAKEDGSDSEHEQEEAVPEDSPIETSMPRTTTNPIPLFGMPPPSVHVDAVSVRKRRPPLKTLRLRRLRLAQ